jgi:hypothetical protein
MYPELVIEKYKIWESEVLRLKGEIYFRMEKYGKANQWYLKSIETCKTSKKSWISFAKACEKYMMIASETNKKDDLSQWASNALESYIHATVFNLQKSKLYISKIFNLM